MTAHTLLIPQAISALESVILGKPQQVRLALATVLAGGHLLLEDVPGVGKTTLSHALAQVLGLSFCRVQFTADMMPADLLGGAMFRPDTHSFSVVKGPIFTQVLLADELNRASAKAQSALLEAMEERQVSLDGETFALPDPFLVIATQNPLSMAGTHPLPESQLDRFLLSMRLGYPSAEAERALLRGDGTQRHWRDITAVIEGMQLRALQAHVLTVHLSDALLDYVQRLIIATRQLSASVLGLSPRAAVGLVRCAQAWALMDQRDYVQPDDIQAVFVPVCQHRLYSQEGVSGQMLAEQVLASTPLHAR
ncbi:AAA family ATPase [Salinispirillum marinum]|uniref:AAA family ATPase n=2 Tax=Saccharospirillaceae TaxID=255527 RepID=A0ABV8BFM8_9GAMM